MDQHRQDQEAGAGGKAGQAAQQGYYVEFGTGRMIPRSPRSTVQSQPKRHVSKAKPVRVRGG